ncbi:MAG TPA: hypothetical protein VK658_01870 [Chryseolinea sp.]|nr:hypothetical protein [Chryseolinea sp.]
MKTILITCAAFCIALSGIAQDDKVKEMDAKLVNKDAVPGPIVAKAQKDFPNASPFNYYSVGESNLNRDWNVTESVDMKAGEKIDYYKVDMKGKNGNFEALYDGTGKLVASKEEQKDVALPPAVRNAWATGEYKGMALEKDKHVKVTDHGKKTEYYVLSLAGGKKVTYDASGKLVKKPK